MRGSKVSFSRLSRSPHGQASTRYGPLKSVTRPRLFLLLSTAGCLLPSFPKGQTARLPGRLTIVGQPGLFFSAVASLPYLTFGVNCSFALSILRRPVV